MWKWPLKEFCDVPIEKHPGAFGAIRTHDIHTGVDLYCKNKDLVFAVEDGTVVLVDDFTGKITNTPWWNDTKAVMIEGATGVVNYGEIEPYCKLNQIIKKGDLIGYVVPVLKSKKENIPGHSVAMLHVELYKHGVRNFVDKWEHGQNCPVDLLNPTQYLTNCSMNL